MQLSQQSQKLPDTCPSPASQTASCSQQYSNDTPWGYLYPNKPNVRWLPLIEDEYVLGRSPKCSHVLGDEIDAKLLAQLSKEHLRIRRAHLTSANDLLVVHLDDMSFNGTYINGRRLGKGRSAVLKNNDRIAMAISSFEAYVYMDSEPDCEVKSFPFNVLSQYSISRKLGAGAYGEVRLVYDKQTGIGYAMKIIQKNKFLQPGKSAINKPQRVQREIKILKRLSHSFVIKFHDVLDHPETVYLVVELVRGGELFTVVRKRRLVERDAKFIFYQLALAIRYLHSQGIIHRDVKLENILLSSEGNEQMIKLADFGLSNFVDSESLLKTLCGTPLYIAPEVLKGQGKPGCYDTQADIWSMGVVLYMCLSGIAPFIQEDKNLPLSKQILTGYYSFPRKYWRTVTYTGIQLVKRMLVVDPKRRITIDEILNHPWLKDAELERRLEKVLGSDGSLPFVDSNQIESSKSQEDDSVKPLIESLEKENLICLDDKTEENETEGPRVKRPRMASDAISSIHNTSCVV